MSSIKEWLSIQISKRPGKVVLATIAIFNIILIIVSALIISSFSLTGTEKMGFFEAAFCTLMMILDSGCIQFVIADIGQANVLLALFCLTIIIIGMISFTGAVIGYITNYISDFIENANSSSRRLFIHDHIVILNWNTRAAEIINDLLYCETKQKVVVLVESRKAEIEKAINERVNDTIARENYALLDQCKDMSFFSRWRRYNRDKIRNNVTVIVREGDVFSTKQLRDISLERANTVIILGNDVNNTICKFEKNDILDEKNQGNAQTVKTLMQVADITAAEYSDDDQRIIVEITDDWTYDLVDRIIQSKQVEGKCKIVPVRVNRILGQLLSQFSLMPELNMAYNELFSNKGTTFHACKHKEEEYTQFIKNQLECNKYSIPLTISKWKHSTYAYFSSSNEEDIKKKAKCQKTDFKVDINHQYWIEHKNVVILGHNSKCQDIMSGFEAFRSEWNLEDDSDEILKILVIDDEKSLEKMDYYRDYPFVINTVTANIYDKDLICSTIENFVSENEEDTCVLILSDDSALNEDIDANALANLVYIQNIIDRNKELHPDFDVESIDVVVEIIDPKHHDVVNNYSTNNVVISNRYISKLITQIGQNDALYDFYTDILTYDTGKVKTYESKEVYAKKASRFFNTLPKPCKASELIRAVFEETTDFSLSVEEQNPTIVLGIVKPGGNMILFEGDQEEIEVNIEEKDKLIVFSNH